MNLRCNVGKTLCLCCLLLVACGYKFTGGGNLPQNVQTVFVSVFENRSGTIALENSLTNNLINEFISKRPQALAKQEQAEAILSGTIMSVRRGTIARTGLDQPLERRVTLVIDVALTDRSGEVIWSGRNVSASQAYEVEGDSAATQQNEREALEYITELLAERVYNRLTDDF